MAESALCCCCGERERDYEARTLACQRCAGRLAGALRQLPELVDEVHGLGLVWRDTRPGRKAVAVAYEIATRKRFLIYEVGPADPVANAFTAGPAKGAWRESRIRGTRPERVPIQLDASDLTAPARAGSVGVRTRGAWSRVDGGDPDQVGHLSVATVLDSWVRDWASLRGERPPDLRNRRERSPVGVLSGWLLDRLEWALREHLALDEFARDVADLFGALWGLTGKGDARAKVMEAECPSCSLLTLIQPYEGQNIECTTTDCQRIITPEEYAEWVRTLINETTAPG